MALALSGKQLMGQTINIQASQAEKNRAAAATKFKKSVMEGEKQVEQIKKERNCRICIQGLIDDKKMQHIDESDIRDYFQGYGTIESIEIPRDHITLKPKGYALIEFKKASEAKDAVNLLNGFEIDGKKISV